MRALWVPPSTLGRVLWNTELALHACLKALPDANIRFPSKKTQLEWAALTQAKEPLVEGVWGFVDGKNYRVQSPTRADLQNAHYNGWLLSTLVTGTLCYGVDGTLVWRRHNCPGSWNDGETSRMLQYKLSDASVTEPGTGVAADSAFPVAMGGSSASKIVTPLKDGDLERASPECRPALLALNNAIVALRQTTEWRMGSAPKCYRQLMLPLPFDPHKRQIRLENIYRIYNYRVRRTGIGQIRSVFNQR